MSIFIANLDPLSIVETGLIKLVSEKSSRPFVQINETRFIVPDGNVLGNFGSGDMAWAFGGRCNRTGSFLPGHKSYNIYPGCLVRLNDKTRASKIGFLYALTNATFSGLIKIGVTKNAPNLRAQQLHTTGVPTPYKVAFCIPVYGDMFFVERLCHSALKRFHFRKEFFKVGVDDAQAILEQTCKEYSLITSGVLQNKAASGLFSTDSVKTAKNRATCVTKSRGGLISRAEDTLSCTLQNWKKSGRLVQVIGSLGRNASEEKSSPKNFKYFLTRRKSRDLSRRVKLEESTSHSAHFYVEIFDSEKEREWVGLKHLTEALRITARSVAGLKKENFRVEIFYEAVSIRLERDFSDSKIVLNGPRVQAQWEDILGGYYLGHGPTSLHAVQDTVLSKKIS